LNYREHFINEKFKIRADLKTKFSHDKVGINDKLLESNKTKDIWLNKMKDEDNLSFQIDLEEMIKSNKKLALPSEWKQVEKDYVIHNSIGKGAYGLVYKAQSIATGEKVAIKMLSGFNKSE
jgi:hypothetical protein